MSSTPSDLTKLLIMMANYYREQFSESDIAFWLMDLGDYSFKEVLSAFDIWRKTNDRMPKISNIVGILEGSSEDRALAALIKVEKAMEMHGAYATVVFDDPGIHATIESLGGWIKACRQTEYEFTWWKKDFRERYQHFDQMGLSPEVPVKLPGILDQANLPLGEKPRKTEVIGDYEKAIEWVSKMEKSVSPALSIRELSQKALKTMESVDQIMKRDETHSNE